jgi:hypothetical protein
MLLIQVKKGKLRATNARQSHWIGEFKMARYEVKYIVGSLNGDSQIIDSKTYYMSNGWVHFTDHFDNPVASIHDAEVIKVEKVSD